MNATVRRRTATLELWRSAKGLEPFRVSFVRGLPGELPQVAVEARQSIPGRLIHGPELPAKLLKRQVTLARIAGPACGYQVVLLQPCSAKRARYHMVYDRAACGDSGMSLPAFPVRVVGEMLGEDDPEQRHHRVEDRPSTAVPAGPAIAAKHADHERAWDRRTPAHRAPGVGDVCHAALCGSSIAVHKLPNDRGDDLGIVVSIRHKTIEQHDHLDANSWRGGR
jgi:hypothetical protein